TTADLYLAALPTRRSSDLAGEARMGEVPVLPQVRNEQPRANGSGEPGNPWNPYGAFHGEVHLVHRSHRRGEDEAAGGHRRPVKLDRKSTRLNSSHVKTSYA